MSRSRVRTAAAALLAAALLVPAAAAACVDCCPRAEARATFVAPPACCGHCVPTLDKRSDPAAVAAKKALVPSHATGAVLPQSARIRSFEPLDREPARNSSGSLVRDASPIPLRL